jgi:methionyl-tRNA formyltransferase
MNSEARKSIFFVGDVIAGRKLIELIETGCNSRLAGIAGDIEAGTASMLSSRVPFIATSMLRSEVGLNSLRELAPDLIINFNSTIIFPPALLKIPALGAANFHPGPLPEKAGLNVGQWAIFEGENEFGVTLHWMNEGIDTGNIITHNRFPISNVDTGLTLHLKTLSVGIKLFTNFLVELGNGVLPEGEKQNLATRKYYGRNAPNGGLIDLSWPSVKIRNLVRALSYRPFRSPTSPPKVNLNGEEIEIVTMEEAPTPPRLLPPGTLIKTSANGVVIATGDGAVRIRSAAKGEHILTANEIAQLVA